ncbi:hypothetical protein ACFSBZ_04855 [Amnibacterium flavum]|nr:hypothetical protein [Amnibacterium flavum]
MPTKAAVLIVSIIVVFFATFLASTVWGLLAGAVAIVLVGTAAVVVCARNFRVEGESDAPRPWWKLTGQPLAGYFVGLIAVLQAGSQAISGAGIAEPSQLIVGIWYLLVAAAFFHSSWRLRSIAAAD